MMRKAEVVSSFRLCVKLRRTTGLLAKVVSRTALLALALATQIAPAVAHHSFGVAFDANQTVTLTGTITKIEWTNPHTHIYADVKGDARRVVSWKFEGYPPTVLSRTGWKREVTIKVGDTITMFGYRARDGSAFAHLREVTLADGKRLFFGPPPGTGEGGAVAR
jgi:hypothetical protein